MKLIKKIISWLGIAAVLLTVFTYGAVAVQMYHGASIPMLWGWGMAVVKTGSMEPTIETGSLIAVRECDAYSAGEIIMYLDNDNNLITHRIVSISDGIVVAKGDANNLEDSPISDTRIVGKVEYIFPGAQPYVNVIRSPAFITALTILFVLIWSAPYFYKRKEVEHEVEQRV